MESGRLSLNALFGVDVDDDLQNESGRDFAERDDRGLIVDAGDERLRSFGQLLHPFRGDVNELKAIRNFFQAIFDSYACH